MYVQANLSFSNQRNQLINHITTLTIPYVPYIIVEMCLISVHVDKNDIDLNILPEDPHAR